MPINSIRIQGFRAFDDSGQMSFGPMTAIVGPNDVGKSVILHGLALFFKPPSRGGISIDDIHGKDSTRRARIEIAFDPGRLESREVKIDAKNKIDIQDDFLVDADGLLHLAIEVSTQRVEACEILINDVADNSFPLALKNQDELIGLLEERNLEAKKAGKETNKEKRDRIRAAAVTEGVGLHEQWVDASGFESQIREVLPEFVFFTDSADYSIGVTSVQNQFKGVVDRALSNNPAAQQFEEEIRATIQGEFDKVHTHLRRLTNIVTALQAHPKVSWRKAVDGIDLNWGDQAGLDLPFEARGAGIRRMFMVAYLQYEAAETILDAAGPRYIFAIEEPEVHLHPGAQRELEAALRGLSSLGHSVVFTTHSPVFASAASIEDLVLVRRAAMVSEVLSYPDVDIAQVALELGVEASDRLVGKDYVILVEGRSDAEFYRAALIELYQAGAVTLDPDQIMFLQCGGISNLQFMVTTRCVDEAGFRWAVIADSDRPQVGGPVRPNVALMQKSLPATCLSLSILERSAIENYLDATAVKQIAGIDCQFPQYGRPTDAAGNPLSDSHLRTIKSSTGPIASAMGAQGLVASSQDANGNSEWIGLFNGIAAAFGF